MLLKLSIKNFLLIKELELDFYSGLSVVTGETGSGKSIIIDALMLLFGAKFTLADIRTNELATTFAAEFDLTQQNAIDYLKQYDLIDTDNPHTLLCRRLIDAQGKNKAYINGIIVTNSQIKELAGLILDIHTQHAPITLLKGDMQRSLLDEYAGITSQVKTLSQIFKQICTIDAQLKLAKTSAANLAARQQELSLAVNELNALKLADNEWEELNQQHTKYAHANSILEELNAAINLLSGSQERVTATYNSDAVSTVLASMNKITTHINKTVNYLPEANNWQQLVTGVSAELAELDRAINLAVSNLEADPTHLSALEERIAAIFALSRKYRITPEEIPVTLSTWQNELSTLLTNNDIPALEQQKTTLSAEYTKIAHKVSLARTKNAQILSNKVTTLLHSLALSGTFNVTLTQLDTVKEYGMENVEYQIGFNQGMPLQALAQAASGGELSRTALALYLTLSMHNPPEVIIFDEIDVGIGGKIAAIVGKMLRELGTNKQVICITHQPHTASYGHNHLVVQKTQSDSATHLSTNYVSDDSRINEIARMLGGVTITDTTLSHATEMLHLSNFPASG